jgi:hypothetical protein
MRTGDGADWRAACWMATSTRKPASHVKYRNEEASKGEFVVEATLRDANKFQVFNPGSG